MNNDLSQPSTIMEQQFDMVIFFVVYPDRLGCEMPKISATWCNTRNCLRVCHLPETNNSHVKMDCWKTNFLLGNPIFGGCVKLPGCNSIQPKKKGQVLPGLGQKSFAAVWAKKKQDTLPMTNAPPRHSVSKGRWTPMQSKSFISCLYTNGLIPLIRILHSQID